MLPLLRFLPRSLEARLVLVVAVLCGLLAMAGRRIVQLQAALDARPLVTETRATAQVRDVRRGPVRVVRKTTTTAPTGEVKVVEQTREVAAEEVHAAAMTDEARKEEPRGLLDAPTRTRYFGVGVSPFSSASHGGFSGRPRLRGGITLWNRLDLGVAYDTALASNRGAWQLEVSVRF